jgi:hypothetical protein
MTSLSDNSEQLSQRSIADTELAELGDLSGTRRGAQYVAAGQAIGTYLDGVDTIWINAANPTAVRMVEIMKGEARVGKPLSTTLESADLVPLLDEKHIPRSLHHIFLDPEELTARLGALAPVRLPVRGDVADQLPRVLTTRTADGAYWLQNWTPNGHEAGTLLVRELKMVGVNLPGATSMNVSGRPEIADQREALAFSREHGIPLLLCELQPSSDAEGSFPILGVGPQGVVLLREGHFPGELFQDLLDYDVDLTQAKPAKYPISPAVRERFASHQLSAHALRSALLEMIHRS